jgi:glycosyltransferase involved in cell wall biosynthesis
MRAHILITRPDWEDVKPLAAPDGVVIRTLPAPRFSPLPARWKAMLRYLRGHAPCIYVPNYDFGHSCISPKLPPEVAVVGVVHSDDPQHYEHAARLGAYWNAIVAVSPQIKDRLRQLAPSLAPRTHFIPYGVELPPEMPNRPGASAEPLRVIYAGRLDEPQKRVLDLPAIIRECGDRGVPVLLRIAGSGPASAALQARCYELGVQDRVQMLGTLDAKSLSRAFSEHDAILLTSAYEGLPIAVLEGMAHGCIPVVAEVNSGIDGLVMEGHNGYRRPVGDIAGFARVLAKLQAEPALRVRLAENARATILSGGYRVEDMADRYVELFSHVFGEVSRGSFDRPSGEIPPPPGWPRQEYLPGIVQAAGHYTNSFFRRLRRNG